MRLSTGHYAVYGTCKLFLFYSANLLITKFRLFITLGTNEPHPELLNELLDELEEVKPEWYDFGLRLPGLKSHELNEIKKDNIKFGVSDCFRVTLDKWLHRTKEGPDKIWINVCEALKKLKNNRLADKIAQKHGM